MVREKDWKGGETAREGCGRRYAVCGALFGEGERERAARYSIGWHRVA